MGSITALQYGAQRYSIRAATTLSLTALATGWNDNKLVISAQGVTSDNQIVVGIGGNITSTQYDAVRKASIVCTEQGNGTITLTAFGEVPEINIPVSVMILTGGGN